MMRSESREESRRDDDERQKDMMMMAEMTIGRERMDQLSSSLSSGKSFFLIKSDFPSDLRTGKKGDRVRR